MPLLEFRRVLLDRKSTRLNSSHTIISYADFCLKKKKTRPYTGDFTSTHAHDLPHAVRPVRANPPERRCSPARPRLVSDPGPRDRIFFFKDAATTDIFPLSPHDAFPI